MIMYCYDDDDNNNNHDEDNDDHHPLTSEDAAIGGWCIEAGVILGGDTLDGGGCDDDNSEGCRCLDAGWWYDSSLNSLTASDSESSVLSVCLIDYIYIILMWWYVLMNEYIYLSRL